MPMAPLIEVVSRSQAFDRLGWTSWKEIVVEMVSGFYLIVVCTVCSPPLDMVGSKKACEKFNILSPGWQI
jgi:hypothetical protein